MKRVVALFAAALVTAAMPAAADAQGRGNKGKQDKSEQQQRKADRDRGGDDRGGYERPERQEREIPLPQLIRMVESRTGGEYINANPRLQGGRKYYWMRLKFPGGRFEDFMVDAATGQF
ncbi:MAG TPA: hypothetical protein VEA44_16615 [Caulobacter sp.]|nr:hypothetical protein [Caulobacter sp.]